MKIALAHFLVNEQLPQFFVACFHAFHLSKVCRINLIYIVAQVGLLFNRVSYISDEYDRFAGITQHLSAILVIIRENACAVFARHRRSLSFYLIISFLFLFSFRNWLEEVIHVCLHGVDDPCFLFELRTFIIESLLLVKKSLLFRLQRLQARQFFISLHGKQCTPRRLKNHKLGFVLCFEARLVFRSLKGIIHGFEALVVGDVLDKRLDFPQSRFDAFQFLAGAVIGAMNMQ